MIERGHLVDKYGKSSDQFQINAKKVEIRFKFLRHKFEKNLNLGFLLHSILYSKSKKIINTVPPKSFIKKYSINIPLHLLYFKTDQFPYTYIHDFSTNPIFRISSPGLYTRQFYNNKSYI